MHKGLLALFTVLAVPGLALADEGRCRVTDPTGTPLNVRTKPNGPIVGTLENGLLVYVIDRSTDSRGKAWVYIGDRSSRLPLGWVFREFISCF
jgi:hypothetical protein